MVVVVVEHAAPKILGPRSSHPDFPHVVGLSAAEGQHTLARRSNLRTFMGRLLVATDISTLTRNNPTSLEGASATCSES